MLIAVYTSLHIKKTPQGLHLESESSMEPSMLVSVFAVRNKSSSREGFFHDDDTKTGIDGSMDDLIPNRSLLGRF